MNLISKLRSGITHKLHGGSLKARSYRGMAALTMAIGFERVLRLVRNMILARILAPSTFGLMAIAMTASLLLDYLSDVGVRQSIIHNRQGATPDYLNTAWWFQVVRGLGLYAFAFLVAPWIGSFYDKPELILLLRVAFSAVIFRGLMSPGAHVLERGLRFKRWSFIKQGGAFIGTLTAIILAFLIRNVWALVIGFVVESISCCILSFIFCPFRPRFTIDRGSLLELMRYGRGMLGLPLLSLIAVQARLKPASMAAPNVLPILSSSFIRSKIRTLASTAIPIDKTKPPIPARVRVTGISLNIASTTAA